MRQRELESMLSAIKLCGLFALHMLIGAIFFIILAAGSFAIDRFTAYIAVLGAPLALVYACRGVEYFMLAMDIICVVVFVLAQTRNYVAKSWSDGQ
jgi:hypothetical protein